MSILEKRPLQESDLLPASLRDDFPILNDDVLDGHPLVFLDNAASTQRPRHVIDAIRRVYEHDYANVHRGIHTLSERSTEQYEQAREKIRRLIHAEHAHEVIFTQGTTAAINLVARSWGESNLQPGDEVLTTVMEHHSNLVPWQQVCQRTGAVLRHVPITDDGRLDMVAFDELLTEKTQLVAVVSISNTLGTVNPIAEIIKKAHAVGALVLVDAAQSVPHTTTDVLAWDADFLAFSGHKMIGPSGIGVLYGKEALLEAMPPFLGGGSMINEVRLDGFTSAALPAKFEAGTPPITPAIGMSAAIDYLSGIDASAGGRPLTGCEVTGFEAIHRHEQFLVNKAYAALSQIDDLRILGPGPQQRAGLISFAFDRIHAHEFAQVLNDQFGVAVRAGHHCTQPLHKRLGITASTRASFYLYNQPEDVDRLVEGILAVRQMFAPKGRKRQPKRE